MKVSEYLNLLQKSNNVCYDIDNHLTQTDMKIYANEESLLEEAVNVICEYRTLVSMMLDKVHIEDIIR